MIYHLSKLVPLRGYPAVKRHESFTKLKAPCAAYYLHSRPGESRTSLAVQHCHFFKRARKKPVENMWNLRVMSSTLESQVSINKTSNMVALHPFWWQCILLPQCWCTLFLNSFMLADSLPKHLWKVHWGLEVRKALFSLQRHANRGSKRWNWYLKNCICGTASVQKVNTTVCRGKRFDNLFWIPSLMVSYDFW